MLSDGSIILTNSLGNIANICGVNWMIKLGNNFSN